MNFWNTYWIRTNKNYCVVNIQILGLITLEILYCNKEKTNKLKQIK